MFTGIVQNQGRVLKKEKNRGQIRLVIRCVSSEKRRIKLGESISVNGVCLTVSKILPHGFAADVIDATQSATTLGSLKTGETVNLERALLFGDSLGGHFVSGHVDARGTLKAIRRRGANWEVEIKAPDAVMDYVSPKGSVAVDGISLTVQKKMRNTFTVSLVPHTLKETSLGKKKAGDAVNLEADVMARYLKLPVHGKKKSLAYKRQGF